MRCALGRVGFLRLLGLAWVVGGSGCAGGQTGSVGTDEVDVDVCIVSPETVDLDQRLPVDFTLRELADAVAGEREVSAYWVPLSDDVVPPIEDETRMRVTITYHDAPVSVEDCSGQHGEPHVPVNVTVEELDGDGSHGRWDFGALVHGTPQRARVTALVPPSGQPSAADAGGLDALAGPSALALLFEPQGLSGTVGDLVDGLHLRLGTACGGHTELSPDETAAGWVTAPAALAATLEALHLSAERDGERTSPTVIIEELGALACYSNAARLSDPQPAQGSPPPTRPTAEVQLLASVALGAGLPAFELERGRLSLWQRDDCPAQEQGACYGYLLRGCADVTDDEAVAALYPREDVVAASACLNLEGRLGDSKTAMGRVEIGADLDAMIDDDIRVEGELFWWTLELEGK